MCQYSKMQFSLGKLAKIKKTLKLTPLGEIFILSYVCQHEKIRAWKVNRHCGQNKSYYFNITSSSDCEEKHSFTKNHITLTQTLL